MSCRKSTQAYELKHWLQGKVRERTAEAVGMIWDMLPITEKTKDEIDFSKVPEGVKMICYCFISDTELTSGKDQPVPVCVHAWQKRLSLEELLENERKVKYLRVSVEFGEDFLFQWRTRALWFSAENLCFARRKRRAPKCHGKFFKVEILRKSKHFKYKLQSTNKSWSWKWALCWISSKLFSGQWLWSHQIGSVGLASS